MVKRCKSLEESLQTLDFTYKEMQKKGLRIESAAERTKRMQNLIIKGLESRVELLPPPDPSDAPEVSPENTGGAAPSEIRTSFYFHKLNSRLQAEYRRLMCDERQNEGMIIKRWLTLLDGPQSEKSTKEVSPESITSFIAYLSKDVVGRHKLTGASPYLLGKCAGLYSQRLIYPLIKDVCRSLETDEERERDALFVQKVRYWILFHPLFVDCLTFTRSLHAVYEYCMPSVHHDRVCM